MSIFNQSRLGLKHYILLLTLLPLFFITTILAIYFVVSRQTDAQDELIRQVDSTIHYLSESSELGLFSGNKESLLNLARTTKANNDIKSVTFFDSLKKEVVSSGEERVKYKTNFKPEFYKEEHGAQWLFQMPVYNSQIEVADFPTIEGEAEPVKFLGWVQIIADKRRLQKKQRSILLTGVSISLLGFSLLALLALKFSHSITYPLDRITKTVKELEAGNLSARVDMACDEAATAELQGLLQGINGLSEKVEESNKSLKKRVDLAVKKLTQTLNELEQKNAQLEQTRTDLIDANKAKDDFLATVSHELRTPLTAILGYCHLLEKEQLPVKQTEYVGVIQQASTILLSLIDNILNFSKLKSDSIELENLPFNLESLLDDVTGLHLPEAQNKGVSLDVVVDLDVPLELIGDELKIKQIINNLLRNAIKFTPQGSVFLHVSLLKPVDKRFGLRFVIKDTGIGMDLSTSPDLFQSFSQADPTISRRFGGTGLGLMICKKLVELFDGKIQLSSEVGKGTDVVFSLCKITKQQRGVEMANPLENYQAEQSSTMLAGVRVLIAEDNVFVKQLLETILESKAADIISVDNGEKALKKCREESIDLVLLDYNMPVLDGLETSKLIRQSFSLKELPIFLITADILTVKKLDLSAVGINEIIYKPINEPELLQNVYRYTLAEELSIIPSSSSEVAISESKVLDYLPQEVILKEIMRLVECLREAKKSKDKNEIKKYAHQICGVAGPSTQFAKIESLARKIEKAMIEDNMNQMDKMMLDLDSLIKSYE